MDATIHEEHDYTTHGRTRPKRKENMKASMKIYKSIVNVDEHENYQIEKTLCILLRGNSKIVLFLKESTSNFANVFNPQIVLA